LKNHLKNNYTYMHEHTKDYKSKKRNLKMNENNLNIKYIPVVRSKSRWSILKFSMIKFYNNLLFILVMVLRFILRAAAAARTPGGAKRGLHWWAKPPICPPPDFQTPLAQRAAMHL
jgi:hypothetical protein